MSLPSPVRGKPDLLEVNRRFYDPLWSDARLVEAERFNTWPLVSSLVSAARPRLEIAPGLRPRLPIAGTHFLDASPPAVAKLRERGANAIEGLVTKLPFADGSFDLVCALDIVEHVEDEDGALSEIARVATSGAALLLSVPLHPEFWTPFDDLVGHRRRYEPDRLMAKLAQHGMAVERSAVYGMKPKSSAFVDFGMRMLERHRERAMWWYSNLMMPLSLRFQKKLEFHPGLIPTAQVNEVLLVCRKTGDPR